MPNLMAASHQWATRPADQRFWDLEGLHSYCSRMRREAKTAPQVRTRDLKIISEGSDLKLIGSSDRKAGFTNWSFGQLCRTAKAPASYLATLPTQTACDALNHSLDKATASDPEHVSQLLFRMNGGLDLRAITSKRYSRVWNADITARLVDRISEGWRVPPAMWNGNPDIPKRAATEADVMRLNKLNNGWGIEVGDDIAPAGLYASDRDMFAFLINEENTIEDGKGGHLGRGFFIGNSEVGDRSFWIMSFLYNFVCGNHIVWGAQDVQEVRMRHIGTADARYVDEMQATLTAYANNSANDELEVIQQAHTRVIAPDKDAVLDAVFGKRTLGLSRKVIGEAYDAAERHEDWYGAPNSVWGMVNGLTEVSQKSVHTNERVAVDTAAGKMMEMDF